MATTPVLGPLAKAAIRLPIRGQKRHKLLILLAAYRDAGVRKPSRAALQERLPFLEGTKESEQKLRGLVKALEAEGWLRRSANRKKNYVLLFNAEGESIDPPKEGNTGISA